MSEKKIRVCDICQSKNVMRMSKSKCHYCGKDVCHAHGVKLSLSFYNSYYNSAANKSTIDSLKISTGPAHVQSSVLVICPECSQSIIKIFQILKKGDHEYILGELIKKIKEIAEVETI